MNVTVTIDGRTYTVTIEDPSARPVIATISGERFEIWPEEMNPPGVGAVAPTETAPAGPAAPAPSPLGSPARTPAGEPAAGGERAITAPIPGVIVALHVAPGDSVTVGQEICTLEAMKMKNSIRSTRAGTITALRVAVGDHVRHGQVLAEFGERG